MEAKILTAEEHRRMVTELVEFSQVIASLNARAAYCGVEKDILDLCHSSIDEQAKQLAQLRA